MNDPISRILEVFETRGGEKYADEDVTQQEHALQCAALAIEAGEENELVVAALLHDIGHILVDDDLPANCTENLDDAHEDRGYQFLKLHFVEAVAEPVKLHVAAKRYLSTINPTYKEKLSPTSLKSLADQGGEMSDAEVEAFRAHPFFAEAIRLRSWDDEAKELDFPRLKVNEFVKRIESVTLKAVTGNGN